jgi:antitoxin HicB
MPCCSSLPRKAGTLPPARRCPGLVTEGDTLEEARTMAADAIRGYLEALVKDGLPIPPEDPQPRREILREMIAIAIEQV